MAEQGEDCAAVSDPPKILGAVRTPVGAPAMVRPSEDAVSEDVEITYRHKKKLRKWYGVSADLLCVRRRFCHRAYVATSRRFGRDTVWYLIRIAAYNVEWQIGDLATQFFSSGGMPHR